LNGVCFLILNFKDGSSLTFDSTQDSDIFYFEYIDEDELEEGLVAVAAPIRELDGRVVGAISISGPSTRLSTKELIRIGDLIISEIDAVQINRKKKPQMPNQKIGKVGAA